MTPNAYSDYGPSWCEAIIDRLNGTAFEIGIESDKKQRGSAVNCEVMDYDEEQRLFILCVRKTDFHPKRYSRTHKDYFLCGENENGNPFAHPVNVIATNARVEVALCRIWNCTPTQLPKIVRQGDVALIPERSLTFKDVQPLPPMSFIVDSRTASHIFTPGALYEQGERFFVAESIQIRHETNQHPFVSARLLPGKLYRVQVGNRAATWGFARPTRD